MTSLQLQPLKTQHSVIWWMLSATALTQTTQFMVMPFMALYMSSKTGATPGIVGLAVGVTPLTATVFSFMGGTMADKFGRKHLMTAAMLLNVLAMVGFALAHSVLFFFVVSFLTGFSRALFGPSSQAMLTDLTVPERRAHIFGLNYWMNNIGASVGPLVGAYLGTTETGWTFYITGCISLLYAVVIFFLFPESNPVHRTTVESTNVMDALRTITSDKALFIFIIAGVCTSLGYSQFDTTLPQMMSLQIGVHAAAEGYAYLFAATGFEVVLFQFILSKLSARMRPDHPMLISQIVYGASFLGLGFSHSLPMYILWSVILTVGEIIAAPQMSQYVAQLAKEDMRGAYFGANSLTNLGFFIGPFLGGILLHHFGGTVVFVIVSVFAFVAGPLYKLSYRTHLHERHREKSVASPSTRTVVD